MSIVAKLPTKRTSARTDRLGSVRPLAPRPTRKSAPPATTANGGRGRKPPKLAVAGQLAPDEAPRNRRGDGSRDVQPAPAKSLGTGAKLADSPPQTGPQVHADALAKLKEPPSASPGARPALEPRFECYSNNELEILTFGEARRKLHTCDFGWVTGDDWLRYAWGGHAWSGLLLSKIKPAGRQFAFRLLTSVGQLTLEDYRREVLRNERASKGLFQAHASRFNRLFPAELRRTAPLFKWWPTIDRNGYKVSAYRVLPERTTFVIAGTDPDTTPPGYRVNWPSFRITPVDPAGSHESAQSGE